MGRSNIEYWGHLLLSFYWLRQAIVTAMRESELLKHIYSRSQTPGAGVLVGPGDDTAVVQIDPGVPSSTLLLTTDQLVEHRHYTPDTPTDLIARKAIARSVSDIAAMGGSPCWALAAATLNDKVSSDDADALFDSMAKWALHWKCPLVGGDISISDGPTILTTTIVGVPHPTRGAVLRSGAKPGHIVCVTGSLGGSFATGRHLTFEPRLAEAAWLCDELGDRLGAMLDLSDGLGRDAGRIAEASCVQITLDSQLIPLAPGAADWQAALGDGEDYELCFTVDGDPPPCTPTGVAITVVGRVRDGAGCTITTPSGEQLDAAQFGWDHHS